MPYPEISYQNAITETMELITPNTPAFQEAVNTIEPPESQPLLPYSVFVRNVSTRPLILVTVRYLFQNKDGMEISSTHSRQWQSHPGGRQMLPQDIAFLPPRSDLASLTASPYLRITADSAVFADGTIVGPDHADRMETENASRQAEREILDEIRSLTQPAAIVHLATVAETPMTEHLGQTSASEYAYRRKTFADQLRHALAADTRPYTGVLSSLTEILRHTPVIHRRPS